jgi:hypothetical protein
MSEGDFTPRSYRPKPLSKAQLRELEKRFEDASERIDEIKKLEQKEHEGGIDTPGWM